jgi:hypothetical protein
MAPRQLHAMRFNAAGASTLTVTAVFCMGGTLVTPNVGSNNVTITAGSGSLEPTRNTALPDLNR